MKLNDLIGLLITRLDRSDIMQYLLSTTKIGSKYWQKLSGENKIQYASMMRLVLEEDHDSDYHLGDDDFQAKQLGRLPDFISRSKEILSDYYLETDKKEGDARTFDFPDKLNARAENSKSAFILKELFKNTRTYQANPEDEESRIRRYLSGDSKSKYAFCKTCKVFQRNTGSCITFKCEGSDFDYYKPNPVPEHPEATKMWNEWLDLLAYGIERLREQTPKDQILLILGGLAPNTNSGFPFFKSQKKQIIPQLWSEFCENYTPKTYKRYKRWFKAKMRYDWVEIKNGKKRKRSKKVPMGMQVNIILHAIAELKASKYLEPFAHFYRTQMSKEPKKPKHRSVFGGGMGNKMLGGLIAAAKEFAEKVTTAEVLKQKVPHNWIGDKFVPTHGNLPFMAQLNWDHLFSMIKRSMPEIDDNGVMQPLTHDEIKELFDLELEAGEYLVDVVGEDFPGYDTGIIREDIDWMSKHEKLGWIIEWILDCLEGSQVWLGGYKIYDIFFKSGHPLTSPIGTGFHWQIVFNVRDYIRKNHFDGCILVSGSVLSDDSIFFWIGFRIQWMEEYLSKFGLSVKEEDSFIYSRDKIVGFLKNLVGYVLRHKGISVIGDPISRELGFLHSEKDVEVDILDNDLKGVYEITGDIEVDSGVSKLASYNEDGADIVYIKLSLINDTPLGRKIIRAIEEITPNVRPYRPDVIVSFPPFWLKEKINVRELLASSQR